MPFQSFPADDGAAVSEGITTGLLGACVVALFYLGVDLMRGMVLLTPSVLGEVFVLRRPEAVTSSVDLMAVGVYTIAHLLAFSAFGLLLVGLVRRAEESSFARYGLLQLFIAFELFFVGVLAIASETTQGLFPLWSVLTANSLAAGVMGLWTWRHHPKLRAALDRNPLGAADVVKDPLSR
jgi:hypothetical protein